MHEAFNDLLAAWNQDVSAPASCPKQTRVLLAVTGLSPQIVTETLYALAVVRKPAWIPNQIKLITTLRGEENARLSLLSDSPGWFHRLRADYDLPEIGFGHEDIHVITGPDGEPLDDILTDADNVALADFITEQVRALTADAAVSLHVTIAGGRKTMGLYIGYALSLFGRSQDQLSHVLVSPPFESLPDFFYPSPRTRVIRDRDGQPLDAKEARVHLGEIPFVRLRDGLPKRLLEGGARFSEAVAEAQKTRPPVALQLAPATRTITAGGEHFNLPPYQFALYWMMAERCRTGRGGVHRSDEGIGDELLKYYGQLVNTNSGTYEQTERAYRNFDAENFDPAKTHVNQALKRTLGERWASPYLIGKLDRIPGTRLHRFGLSLPPEAIKILPASLPAQQACTTEAHKRKPKREPAPRRKSR
jgi:CRISPR-associated protein (TIGR02584 family)